MINLVADLVERGQVAFDPGWVEEATRIHIEQACAKIGLEKLRALKDALPPEVTYEDIRLVTAHLRSQRQGAN